MTDFALATFENDIGGETPLAGIQVFCWIIFHTQKRTVLTWKNNRLSS